MKSTKEKLLDMLDDLKEGQHKPAFIKEVEKLLDGDILEYFDYSTFKDKFGGKIEHELTAWYCEMETHKTEQRPTLFVITERKGKTTLIRNELLAVYLMITDDLRERPFPKLAEDDIELVWMKDSLKR